MNLTKKDIEGTIVRVCVIICICLMFAIVHTITTPKSKTTVNGVYDSHIPTVVYNDLSKLSLLFQKQNLDFITLTIANVDNIVKKLQYLSLKDEHYINRLSTLSSGKKERHTRYEKEKSDVKIVVWSWKGGDSVRQDQLRQTIQSVLGQLPMIPNSDEIVDLLLETCATESHRGKYVKQMRGPAVGIYQMEPRSLQDTLRWLQVNHLDVYDSVQKFYNRRESLDWNYKYNVPWQTALAASYYWRMCGTSLVEMTIDLPARAAVYKRWWNTSAGSATVDKYFADCERYLS